MYQAYKFRTYPKTSQEVSLFIDLEQLAMIDVLANKQSEDYLSGEDAVLILLVHQKDFVRAKGHISSAKLRQNFLAVANLSNIFGIPIVLSSTQVDDNNNLLQEIIQICPHAQVVDCINLINAWQDVNFKAVVETIRRRQIILAGVSKDICFAFTAISAALEGYQVYAVMDTSGDWESSLAEAALEKMIEVKCTITNRVAVTVQLQLQKENGI
jgi:isochorismate hydrolase